MSFLPLVIISLLVGFVASMSTVFISQGLNTWVPDLIRPEWMPTDTVFMAAWITIYLLLIIAVSRTWFRLKASPQRAELLGLFAVNGLGNLLWSFFFFSQGWLKVAFADLIFVEITVLILIAMLWKVERNAAWCLVPYALWLVVEGVLNYQILLLNPF